MPRPTSAASDQEEGNDIMMQEELDRLRNQYRVLQNERNKYIEETQQQMKKYQSEIGHLEGENVDLRTELNQAESNQNKRKDEKELDRLKRLSEENDDFNEKIEEEKQKAATCDAEIRKYEKLIKSTQSQRAGSGVTAKKDYATTQAETLKKIRTMENRLSKKNNKYNTTLTDNGRLREEIEKLRNERNIFNGIYKRLEEELEKLNLQKEELTEQATLAYDQRDEANNKCLALKDKNDKDKMQFEMETRDLQRIIDHDNRLRDFMNTKANERMEWKRKEEERRKMHGSAGEIAREQQRLQINTFEEAFNRIREITQREDMDLIISEFIKHEDDNFAFFQYVSELNNKVENLFEEIQQLREDIDRFKSEEQGLEDERKKILEDIEKELAEKKLEADASWQRLTEVNKILDQLRAGVKSLFKKIRCDDSVILDMLGGDNDVTDRNLMLYMGSVEQRTNELLSVHYYIQTKNYQEEVRQEPPEHGMTLGITASIQEQRESTIIPPAIGDEFEDSDEDGGQDLRPLSQAELMNRVCRDLKKREGNPGGMGKAGRSFQADTKRVSMK